MRGLYCFTLVFLTVFIFSADLNAQSRERNPVAVVLSPELSGTSAYLVERRLEHTPHDVIHLRPGADEAVLTEAIWVLLAAWDRDGVDPTTPSTFTQESQDGSNFTKLPWVPRVVDDLNSAQVVGIDGVGMSRPRSSSSLETPSTVARKGRVAGSVQQS